MQMTEKVIVKNNLEMIEKTDFWIGLGPYTVRWIWQRARPNMDCDPQLT